MYASRSFAALTIISQHLAKLLLILNDIEANACKKLVPASDCIVFYCTMPPRTSQSSLASLASAISAPSSLNLATPPFLPGPYPNGSDPADPAAHRHGDPQGRVHRRGHHHRALAKMSAGPAAGHTAAVMTSHGLTNIYPPPDR